MNYVLPYSNFSYLLKIILKIFIVKINPIDAGSFRRMGVFGPSWCVCACNSRWKPGWLC